MFDVSRVQQDFSVAATRYDNYAVLQQRVLSSLIGMTPTAPSARVLDAGCGTGRLARQMTCDITQMDLAYSMCARAALSGKPVVNACIETLPFADASFGAVFSSLVLQWVPDWQDAVVEMKRVLKPGGMLAISTFGPSTLTELKESFAAVDRYSHISAFLPCFEETGKEVVTEYYPDLKALMRHLKAIGARNKLLERRRSLMTGRQFARIEQCYRDRFGSAQGLPVTWEIIYSVTRKP